MARRQADTSPTINRKMKTEKQEVSRGEKPKYTNYSRKVKDKTVQEMDYSRSHH